MLRPPEPADPVVVGISARFRDAIIEAHQDHQGRDALRVAAGVIENERGIGSLGELSSRPASPRSAAFCGHGLPTRRTCRICRG